MKQTWFGKRFSLGPGARHLLAHAWIAGVLLAGLISAAIWTYYTAAAAPCASSDQAYTVASGDTLGSIASRYNTTWQWTDRAYQFGWHVSSSPVAGSIIDLQPWVQGAHGLGHVAFVEQLLSNGDVIASNMNWGANPTQVTDVQFSPGPGVTFLWA